MHALRYTYGRLCKVACLVFAVHVFNLSVDFKDQEAGSEPEDLSINDIESFAELITENILGFNDTFEEHDEHDETNNGSIQDLNKIFWAGQSTGSSFCHAPSTRMRYFIRNSHALVTPAFEISAPPPKG